MPDFLRNCADVLEPTGVKGWWINAWGYCLTVGKGRFVSQWGDPPSKRQIADFVLGTGILRDATRTSSTGPKIA